MINIRIKTLPRQRMSKKASKLFLKSNLNEIKLPEEDYNNFLRSTRKIKFKNTFKFKNNSKSTKKYAKSQNNKKKSCYNLNYKYKSNFRLKRIQTNKKSINLVNLHLYKKISFLEMSKNRLEQINNNTKKDKTNLKTLKSNVQNDIKENFKFMKRNMNLLKKLTKKLNKNNMKNLMDKKLLISIYFKEKKNIEDLKDRIGKATALMDKLQDFKEKQ